MAKVYIVFLVDSFLWSMELIYFFVRREEEGVIRHLVSTLLENTPRSLLPSFALSILSLPQSHCTQEQGEYGLQSFHQPCQFRDRVWCCVGHSILQSISISANNLNGQPRPLTFLVDVHCDIFFWIEWFLGRFVFDELDLFQSSAPH